MSLIKNNPFNILVPIEEREEFLLYNTLTGGLDVLTYEDGIHLSGIAMMKNADSKNYSQNFINELSQKEYLIDSDFDVLNLLEKNVNETQFKNAGVINLTIGTTITCNMGCSYCFEFVKPNHTLKDDKVKKGIVDYISQIVTNSGKNVHTISVTWYGGEPLINVKAIKDLSVDLRNLAQKFNLKYEANVITNGIYLDKNNADILVKNGVKTAQITIDGAREVHDRKRPLKQTKGENYFKIIRNIAEIDSKELSFTIRLNIDKEVAQSIPTLLDDFYDYGIWPQKNAQIHFDPAWLRSYEEIDLSEEEGDKRMSVDEYFEFKQNFRLELIKRYNAWATKLNKNTAKLKWDLPMYQSTCATWASPISLVIDPNGYVHKCWETIHDDTKAPTNVFEPYDPNRFEKYSAFNRYTHSDVCRNCSYLPICDKISCSFEAIKKAVPECTPWKYKLENYLKTQYLRMVEQPETITIPLRMDTFNSGHSNK